MLRIWAGGSLYELELGERGALAWAGALARPPPTLAEKLGISTDKPVNVLGTIADEATREAIGANRAETPDAAAQLICILASEADLAAALSEAALRNLPTWCLYPKGKGACPGGGLVRASFRGAGWVDTKSCAVSETLTATRYHRRSP